MVVMIAKYENVIWLTYLRIMMLNNAACKDKDMTIQTGINNGGYSNIVYSE